MPSAADPRRRLERLLSGNFSPAQLHEVLQRLFGQCLTERLPPLEYYSPEAYFFDSVNRLDRDGYLAHEVLGNRLVVELRSLRPSQVNEIRVLADELGLQALREHSAADNRRSPEELLRFSGDASVNTKHASRVRLNINIANGSATASWRLGEDECKDSAPLPADSSLLHAAQQKLIDFTQNRCTPEQIAEASSALGSALSQHLFQGNIQAQFMLALNQINDFSGELHLELEFGGGENLAQLSWELLREPHGSHAFLSTLPRVFLTRRYPRTMMPMRWMNPPRRLLLVVGAHEGHGEANEVRRIWESKGFSVRLVDTPDMYELNAILQEGPWEVMHLIAHGHPEDVRLKDRLSANQLANMARGNVQAAVVLSVCTSASANIQTDRVAVDVYDRGSLAWRGVAQALIGAGVPDVLAWTNLAYVDECARITPEWHEMYLTSGDARQATRKARSKLLGSPRYSFGWLAHFTG